MNIGRCCLDSIPMTIHHDGKGTSSTTPMLRGQYEHWALIASVLEHKDNVDILCSKLSIIDPVFTCVHLCFSIVIPFG
jgi:hypothetical protein